MRKPAGLAAAITATLLTSTTAWSNGDLPLRYNVEDKPLKEAVTGTMLTFDLYSDSACTNLVVTAPIPIDDVTVSKLKLFTPSGGTKAPKTATMETVLSVPSGAASYLKVTGTGIVAVGGDCQAQSAGTSGKVVSTSSLNGAFGSFPVGGGVYAFAGPVTTLATTASQVIVATAEASLNTFDPTLSVTYAICYQPNAGGALTSFSGSNEISSIMDNQVRTLTATGATAPGSGLWKIGYCVKASTAATLFVGGMNGWAMVLQ